MFLVVDGPTDCLVAVLSFCIIITNPLARSESAFLLITGDYFAASSFLIQLNQPLPVFYMATTPEEQVQASSSPPKHFVNTLEQLVIVLARHYETTGQRVCFGLAADQPLLVTVLHVSLSVGVPTLMVLKGTPELVFAFRVEFVVEIRTEVQAVVLAGDLA